LSHPAVFKSGVQCVRLAAGRHALNICCDRRRLVFNCCFLDTDLSQLSVATHLGCDGNSSDSIIKIFSWFKQWNKFENLSIFEEVKAYKTNCAVFSWGGTLYDTVSTYVCTPIFTARRKLHSKHSEPILIGYTPPVAPERI